MKLSLIHNQYKRNPYVRESIALCVHALKAANVDYEYIIFNDCGDKEIFEDIKHFAVPNLKYIYSDVNHGKKLCTGGWVGALPHVTGDLIHNMGQDDIFTPTFYKMALDEFQKDDKLMLIHFNAIQVLEDLTPVKVMLDPNNVPDYYNQPVEMWKAWFGVGDHGQDKVTRANNNMLAPGVIYRTELHKLIGPPDIESFLGAADFEFWARVLFYGYKCKSIGLPTWLYRTSNYSTSVGNDGIIKEWVDKIQKKYEELYRVRQTMKPA